MVLCVCFWCVWVSVQWRVVVFVCECAVSAHVVCVCGCVLLCVCLIAGFRRCVAGVGGHYH